MGNGILDRRKRGLLVYINFDIIFYTRKGKSDEKED